MVGRSTSKGLARALTTKRRVLVKVTLEGLLVYEFEMWVLPHSAGVDVALGMDFMIPAGGSSGPVQLHSHDYGGKHVNSA
ncbi:hypothetical protein PC112_g11334 [Phytophthora cactorum]|nr:hypothetical protein PC112_g11334 [Phytophthora cactorum]